MRLQIMALAIGLCCASLYSKAQVSDSVVQNYYKTLNQERSGKGTGSFSTSPQKLQSFFTSTHRLKDFENSLSQWVRLTRNNSTGQYPKVSMEWNEETNEHDKALFSVYYLNMPNNDILRVDYGLDEKLRSISFKITEDEADKDKLGSYINKLKAAGYKFDRAATRISNALGADHPRLYAKNPATKINVLIRFVSAYTYEVIMFNKS